MKTLIRMVLPTVCILAFCVMLVLLKKKKINEKLVFAIEAVCILGLTLSFILPVGS